jgi:predicted dehydrogenase
MGKAHSHALRDVSMFFDLPAKPVMKTLCGIGDDLAATADRFGWQASTEIWREVVEDPEIDIVDICTPGNLHAEMAIAAAQNGKHVFCEKPLALNYPEARRMYEAVGRSGMVHMVNFNYRRVPAIALAKKIIDDGRIGRILMFQGTYRQDWPLNPDFPFLWRMDRDIAGAGSMADKGSHLVDLARFLAGEFETVAAASEIFVRERPLSGEHLRKRLVTTDDAAVFTARFSNGALGVFGTSRMAAGRKNALAFEVNGTTGSLRFDLERLNELEFYAAGDRQDSQGFRRILATESVHPYMHAWWPPGHTIGWEHTFIHQYAELLKAVCARRPVAPSFFDGVQAQQVLEAVEVAAREARWVAVAAREGAEP